MKRVCLVLALSLLLGRQAVADSVFLLDNGNGNGNESVIVSLLQGRGDTVTVGNYPTYTGSSLSSYNAVILDDNSTGYGQDMPSSAGQTALLNYVSGGGRLVTTEWIVYDAGVGAFSILQPAIPVVATTYYDSASALTYTQSTPNATLNAGVSSPFSFTADNHGGTETNFVPKLGATVYYASSGGNSANGLIGWNYGAGQVFSFSTIAGPGELANPNYSQLFVNAVDYNGATVPEPCSLIALAGLGSMGLIACVWRRRRATA